MTLLVFVLTFLCVVGDLTVVHVSGLDLGPIVRIAQCRSQCLRKHSIDGSCRGEIACSQCWQNCEDLENQWEKTKTICEDEQYQRCPACETACLYRKTRVDEKYLPSMLPAPSRGPVTLDKYDVAVAMRRVHRQWKESGYYPGGRAPSLRPDTWIIAVVEEGVKHYSWQEWVPTLESLREGALYEATITWKDVSTQLNRQRELEQKRFNDRVRQSYLEKYGEKVLAREDSHISEEVFRKFFFRRKDEQADKSLETDGSPSTRSYFLDENVDGPDEKDKTAKKESYVVSWEPESGGLMGNQVTDSNTAQISLLPGIKYLVRIASNEGPGSFPIEVDTRPGSVQVRRVKRNFEDFHSWDIYAGCAGAALIVSVIVLIKICRRSKSVKIEEV